MSIRQSITLSKLEKNSGVRSRGLNGPSASSETPDGDFWGRGGRTDRIPHSQTKKTDNATCAISPFLR